MCPGASSKSPALSAARILRDVPSRTERAKKDEAEDEPVNGARSAETRQLGLGLGIRGGGEGEGEGGTARDPDGEHGAKAGDGGASESEPFVNIS